MEYIKKNRPELDNDDKRKVPWKQIMTSPAVWAIIVAHTCYNFGFYILLSWLPTFFKEKLSVSLDNLSFYLTVPYVAMVIFGNLSGWIADYLIVTNKLTVASVRKIHNSIALGNKIK